MASITLGKVLIALLVPGSLMAGLSRFAMNTIVGFIATLGIMMAVFDAYKHGPVLMSIGTLSTVLGFFVARRLLMGKKLTE